MKKIILLSLFASLLLGCQAQDVERLEQESVADEGVVIQSLKLPADELRFVAGWLDEETIGYVVHQQDEDQLQTFNIITGEIDTVYADVATISEVKIHSLTKQILIKKAQGFTEATLVLLDRQGRLLDELLVESSELEIQWNPANSTKLLLTAFSEEWTYDIYRYDTTQQLITPILLPDPFPQWLGEEAVVYSEDGAVSKQSLSTNDKLLLASNVNQLYASSTQLVVEVVENEQSHYKLLDVTGREKNSWQVDATQPIVHVEIVDDQNLVMSMINETEEEPTTSLLHMRNGQEIKRHEVQGQGGVVSCSTSNYCLFGYSFETLIDLETGETVDWLVYE